MLISKFDLCRSEWLELVFAKRNKEYGAYYIRQHHNAYLVKAMGITFTSITAAFIAGSIFLKPAVVLPTVLPDPVKITEVTTVTPPKKEEPKPASARPAKSTRFLVPVVTNEPVTETPPDVTKITGAVGPQTFDEPDEIIIDNVPDNTGPASSGTVAKPEDVSVHPLTGLEEMPEPFGGAAGWTKFLQKNLRYPAEASEKGASGKVWVSFVVEKDGHLSNITVDKGAGYGMDEEAVRVLKLSKAWKPGKQNGQLVRVKYVLPLSFILNGNN